MMPRSKISLLLFAAILCLAPKPALAKQKIKPQRIVFDFHGKTREATLFVPLQQGPLPVIVLLHGSGRNGAVMVAEWKDLALREGIVLVAPDALHTMGWSLNDDPLEFFHEAVERARAIHPIDDQRIYLFGHSAGAQFALALVLLDSGYYAAAAIHAGTLPPGITPALSLPHRRMPVAIWVGDRDPNFPADAVRDTKRVMDENGYDVRLSVMAQHDHNYYAVSGTVNTHAWEFLKQYQLPTPTPSE